MKTKHLDSYKDAVANVSRYMDMMKELDSTFTVFDGSTALAICFCLPKQKTLQDIIKYRVKSE